MPIGLNKKQVAVVSYVTVTKSRKKSSLLPCGLMCRTSGILWFWDQ